jgi:hypothetical protein
MLPLRHPSAGRYSLNSCREKSMGQTEKQDNSAKILTEEEENV